MNASSRSFRGKSQDRPSHDLPENVGNRRTFEELKIPPDDVGNHEERDTISAFVHDSLGNSVDEEPAHLRSGILSQFGGNRSKSMHRRMRDGTSNNKPKPIMQQRPMEREHKRGIPAESVELVGKDLTHLGAEDYMAHLTNEFTRLLRLRLGVPFSFAMKPVTAASIDETHVRADLDAILKLIRDIFAAATITASVSYLEYCTPNHRFAVFYVSPKEKDAVKNKDLISALRQIVKLHGTKKPTEQTNVLLVLANAQHVIEEHLFKIGAKKISS